MASGNVIDGKDASAKQTTPFTIITSRKVLLIHAHVLDVVTSTYVYKHFIHIQDPRMT